MALSAVLAVALMGGTAKDYPVVARQDGVACSFQIQDMIMRDSGDVSKWFADQQTKPKTVVVFWPHRRDRRCAFVAGTLVRNSGYKHVTVRRGDASEYWMGPPRPK